MTVEEGQYWRHFGYFGCCGMSRARGHYELCHAPLASGIEAATADETAQQAQPEARARPDAQTPTQSPSYSKYRGSVGP